MESLERPCFELESFLEILSDEEFSTLMLDLNYYWHQSAPMADDYNDTAGNARSATKPGDKQ